MKHIYLNLKRFDIPREMGGVNNIAPIRDWGGYIINSTKDRLRKYDSNEIEFAIFFPEAHIIGAINALNDDCNVKIGCQGVFREDTSVGGNFGAYTTGRTANSMKALGCDSVIIGHCEERKSITGIMSAAGVSNNDVVNRLLNEEIKNALRAEMNVLYCIGESIEEQTDWQNTLRKQLEIGLEGVQKDVVIAYEPIWAIGPGKTPPDRDYIQMVGRFIKEVTNGANVVYGGGLKTDNAQMLASIPEIDGGLIALTRFNGEIGFYPEEYLEIIEKYLGC